MSDNKPCIGIPQTDKLGRPTTRCVAPGAGKLTPEQNARTRYGPKPEAA